MFILDDKINYLHIYNHFIVWSVQATATQVLSGMSGGSGSGEAAAIVAGGKRAHSSCARLRVIPSQFLLIKI